MRTLLIAAPILIAGSSLVSSAPAPAACSISVTQVTSNGVNFPTYTTDNEVSFYVKNTGTVSVTITSESGTSSSGLIVTGTAGAGGNTLPPGGQIDAQVYFDTGAATSLQWVEYTATPSCGSPETDDVTGITVS